MNTQFYHNAGYVPPVGTRAESKSRQGQWDEVQPQHRTRGISTNDIPEDPNHQVLTSISRKRADSHPPTSRSERSSNVSQTDHFDQFTNTTLSRDHDEWPRRSSSGDHKYGNSLSPQSSPSTSHGEVRRLSDNFNAPTDIELERNREHRKSLKGVERLRSRVKGWVRA